MTQRGLVEEVSIVSAGSFTAAASVASADRLYVVEAAPFVNGAGSLSLGDVELQVASMVPGEGPDDPDLLIFAGPVGVAVDAGEPVTALPLSLTTYASVVFDGESDPVEVLVDQDLQSKVDLRPGSYYEDERPVVVVDDVNGRQVIVGVEGLGADDASRLQGPLPQDVIDESNLPSGGTDPVAPTSSPTPTVRGFAGVLLALWDGVSNATPVMYDVHISPSNGAPPSSSTLLDSVAATIESMRTLADTTPLAYDTDYYVAIVARSGDQYAAPSPWVGPTRMDRTRSADLAVDALDGKTITGALIRTASSGARVELSTAEGVRGINSAGDVVTQIDPQTGRLSASDGVFTGTIAGGSISIASATGNGFFENFSTASGLTPPSGWSKVGDPSQTDFAPWDGSTAARVRGFGGLLKDGFAARDLRASFDVRLPDAGTNGPGFYVAFRNDPVDEQGNVRLAFLPDRSVSVFVGNTGYGVIYQFSLTGGPRVRFEVMLQGQIFRIRLLNENGFPQSEWKALTFPQSSIRSGRFGFAGTAVSGSPPSTWYIDNISVTELARGLEVRDDGSTDIQTLLVGTKATVPAPIAATDAANKGYVDTRAAHVRLSASGGTRASGTTLAAVSGMSREMGFNESGVLFTSGETVTVLVDGLYYIGALISYASSNAGNRLVQVGNADANDDWLALQLQTGFSGNSNVVTAGDTRYVAAGTRLRLRTWQNSGSTLSLGTTAWSVTRID